MAHRGKNRAPMPLPGQQDSPSDAAAPPPLPARRPPPAPPSQTQSHPVHVTKLNAAEESDEDDSYEEPSTARLNDSQEIYDDFEGEELPPISPYNPTQEAPQEIYDDFEEEQHGEIYEDAEDCGPEVTVLSPPSQAPPLPSMEGRRRGSQPPLPPVPSNKKDADDCGPEVTVLIPPSQAPPLPTMEGHRRGSQPPLPPVPSNRKPSDAAAPPPLPARRPPPAPPSQTQSHSDEDDSYEEPSTARLNDSQDIYDDFVEEEPPPISPYNPTQEAPQELSGKTLYNIVQPLTRTLGFFCTKIYDDFEEEQHGEISEDADDCGPEVTDLIPPRQAPPLTSMEGRRRGSQRPLPPVPSNRKPVVSGLNTTREPECVVPGLSRQADSKYNEITHTKGSRLIKEQSDPEPSSTEIITRHSKWHFDVLIIRGKEAFSLEIFSELLTKNGFKCETISFWQLHKDHHMLKSSQYVVYHGKGWHFDKELFEVISFHHKRVIWLYYEGFPLSSRRHLPPDMVLTFINMMGKFWREDLLEQLGRREHQTQRETTFDDELTEKSHQLFDSVYGFGKNRPDFLVHWTDQKQREESMTAWKRGDRKDKTKTPSYTKPFSGPSVSWKQTIVILHNHADGDFASILKNHLETKKGYVCSLQSDLKEKSQDIEKSSIIIILVSKKSLENEFLKYLMPKMMKINQEEKTQIIPVVLDDVSVPQGLQSFKKVNVGEKMWQEKLTALLEDAENTQQFLRESTYDDTQFLYPWTEDFDEYEVVNLGQHGDRLQAYSDADSFLTARNIPSVYHIYQQPLHFQAFQRVITQNLKSRKQKIEESFPKVFSGLYDHSAVPSFTVKEKGDTITINWTEENLKRKLYTVGNQEVGEASGIGKTDKEETTGMRRAEQGERTGMRKTGAEGEKEYVGATKLAQKEEKYTVNLEEVLESYAREGKKYEDFREAVHKSLGSESSWRTIASVLYATKNVMSRLGTTMAAPLRQLAEKFVQEECADFIIQQGGWEAVLDEECSDLESD